MPKLTIEYEASQLTHHETFDFDDLGLDQEIWDKMDDKERAKFLQEVADENPEPPSWIVSSHSVQ